MKKKKNGALMIATLLIVVFGWTSVRATSQDNVATDKQLREELMNADREFAKSAAAKGLDGWMEFIAQDAVRIPKIGGKAIFGKAKVREADASIFSDPNTKLVWEPVDGGAFTDKLHGFTTGRFRVLQTKNGTEAEVGKGGYVSWWRK